MGRDPAQDPLGEVAGLGAGGLGQQHDELLAAVARHDVHRPLLPLEQGGELLEHPVAHQVPVGVVDLLEVVDVDHHAGEHRGVPGGAVHLLLQLLHQRAAVEAVGERIGLRQVPHLLLAHDRVLEVVGLLQRRHRRVDDLLRELHVLLVERGVVRGGAQEEDAGRLLPQGEADGDRADRVGTGLPSDSQPVRTASIERVGVRRRAPARPPGRERMLDLGVAAEVHRRGCAAWDSRTRRRPCRVSSSGSGDDDRAAGDVEALRHPPHQDLVDLVRLERGGHLLHDVHHLGAGPRLGARLVQLAAHPQVRLHPRQQLPDPERLGDEVGGAQAQRADGGLFRRHGRDHEHRQVLEAGIGLDPLQQLQAVHLGHHDVEQQQIELLGGRCSKRCSPPGTVSTS